MARRDTVYASSQSGWPHGGRRGVWLKAVPTVARRRRASTAGSTPAGRPHTGTGLRLAGGRRFVVPEDEEEDEQVVNGQRLLDDVRAHVLLLPHRRERRRPKGAVRVTSQRQGPEPLQTNAVWVRGRTRCTHSPGRRPRPCSPQSTDTIHPYPPSAAPPRSGTRTIATSLP